MTISLSKIRPAAAPYRRGCADQGGYNQRYSGLWAQGRAVDGALVPIWAAALGPMIGEARAQVQCDTIRDTVSDMSRRIFMKPVRTARVRLPFARTGPSGLARRGLRAGVPLGFVTIALAAALAIGGVALAADECGPPRPGIAIACTPSNYDAAQQGNIFYGSGVPGGDFSIRLADGLAVGFDRDDPDDDIYRADLDPPEKYRYGAVVVVGGESARNGDIAVWSSAEVASAGARAHGYMVGRIGASGRVRLDLTGGSVTTNGDNGFGVLGFHVGTGDLVIGAEGGSVDTRGARAFGIFSDHIGTGNNTIDVRDMAISAEGTGAEGIRAQHLGRSGDIAISVREVDIGVDGQDADGIVAYHSGGGDIAIDVREVDIGVDGQDANGIGAINIGTGDLGVAMQGTAIGAKGDGSGGVRLQHVGTGDLGVAMQGTAIGAEGDDVVGVWFQHRGTGDLSVAMQGTAIGAEGENAHGVHLLHIGTGDLDVDARGGGIVADGLGSRGIYALHFGTGDVVVDAEGIDISATGEVAQGVHADHAGSEGDIAIHLSDATIMVAGDRVDGISATGVRAQHFGTIGDVDIHLRGTTVTAAGEGASGIEASHETGKGSIRIRLDGGTVHVEDPAGVAVWVGELDEETGAVVGAAEVGADGYRRQSVMVDGRVRGGSGDGAGIRLAGGGRVEIGSRGSVGAASGIAVRALGDGAALRVSAEFDGRRAGDVIDGEILNKGGRTTIAVNGVTLHDGMAGATGLWAPNGARDVTLVAADAVVGRGFSTADFVTGPYAPRAAVYEALPGFLLRLDGRGTAAGRLRKPGSPAWVRVSGGKGSYGSDRSSVGASYDFGRFGVEAGLDAALSPAGDVTGSVSLRHVRGSADVSAPTGGGSIEAEGIGAALGATWRNDAGYYVDGRISITRYKTDLRSGGRGRLKEDAESTVRSLGVEAGRRLALGERMHLTPRAWLARSDVSLSGFRDTVGTRVSLDEAARSAAGLGVVVDTVHVWDGGERTLSLRGELGVERTLGHTETVVDVSGERLRTEPTRTRAVLGFGGEYRWGRWSLGGEIAASGLGSEDSDYVAGLRFGMRFW